MSYDGYLGRGGIGRVSPETHDFGVDWTPDTPGQAALSVAVMLVACAAFLTVLKKSGFRAMVAVGRG